jgi:ABC-type bacteriocin/lantibiotic exporter with double-glycine peptidase domain
VQRAIRYFRVPVSNETIKESLLTNPHYPTFKSICDVLNEWGIENYPLKYETVELKDIEPPYIAHLKDGGGQLSFVTKLTGNKVYYFDSDKSRKSISLDRFLEKTSGGIILMNPSKNSGENEYSNKRQNEILNNAILPTVIGTFLLYSIINFLITLFQSGPYFDRLN